jgi:hypothetical protein
MEEQARDFAKQLRGGPNEQPFLHALHARNCGEQRLVSLP